MGFRVVDCDNFDGVISDARVINLRDRWNTQAAIVGTQHYSNGVNYTDQQTGAFERNGVVVPCHYDFTYFDGQKDYERMKYAAGFGKPVVIDEETATGWEVDKVVDNIARCREVLKNEGLFGGHYTAPGWWASHTANSKVFKGDPLWYAAWPFARPNGPAVLPPEDFFPLFDFADRDLVACFSRPFLWQYADVMYDEPSMDMSWAEDKFWEVPVPGPAPAPVEEQNKQQNMLDLIAGLDPLYWAEFAFVNAIGQRVFVLHLKSGGDPDPAITIAV